MKRHIDRRTVLVSSAAAAATIATRAWAKGTYDPGASDSEIKIGNINPYSGPASAYSQIGKTIGACFK
jgi:branched-chain amino acid transport system substrate-binding protein